MKECEPDGNAGVGDGGGVVMMSARHECAGGTPGSGIMSNAADLLGMRVVCGMRGVGGVCEMCICLARGGVGREGGEWIRGWGLGYTNPVGIGGVLDVCLFLCCSGVGSGLWLGPGSGRVVWCVSPDSLCRWQDQVSVYCARRIPAHLRCTQGSICRTLSISTSYRVFVCGRSRHVCVLFRTWIFHSPL